jgi:hypothetical protein
VTRNTWKALGSCALVLAGLAPWLVRSDVERLVVLQRHVLLGRYSTGWFFALAFAITPGCWIGAWALWRSRTLPHRVILFRLLAVALALVVGWGLVETAARLVRRPTYYLTTPDGRPEWPADQRGLEILHRAPNRHDRLTYDDVPAPARSYPGHPRGYPTLPLTLTTDARGFRNPRALDRCDLLVVGDSFAEGCLVSDDQAFPVLLGKRLGRVTYNLGVAGADPRNYRDTLLGIGLGLKPRTVVVAIYEDNDFDGADRGGTPSLGARVAGFFRGSPVVKGLTNALTTWLGPIGADAPLRDFDAIGSWMPLHVPDAGGAVYALKPKRLLLLATSRATFEASYGWTSTVPILEDIVAACREAHAELLFVVVPSKPRVLLPLVRERVSPAQIHAFVAMRRDPGPAKAFADALFAHMAGREEALRALCKREGVRMLSLAPALRAAAARGRQVYYAYDQHWSPIGHQVAAATIAAALRR